MDTIQINKFSHLHDGEKVFFCKTDFLLSDFNHIKTLNHDVILISGNSDYVIDDHVLNYLPSNVKYWFAQNSLVDDPRVISLPLGIENYKFSDREGHGIGYERVKIKDQIIADHESVNPKKLCYANFRPQTNPHHRNMVKKVCQESEHIDWVEPNLTIEEFFHSCLNYETVVCPKGNGPDTHRFYETLYMGRIPITFDKKMYEKLYYNFPVIFMENIEELKNEKYLRSELSRVKSSNYKTEMLDCQWWINQIKAKLETL